MTTNLNPDATPLSCPKCGQDGDLEILVDAYSVYGVGVNKDNEVVPMQHIRYDEFDDQRIVCQTCGEEYGRMGYQLVSDDKN